MSKQVLMFLRGLPGSGKTTFAKKLVEEHNWVRINKDEIRRYLVEASTGKWKWSPKYEGDVIRIRDDRITKALEEGRNVVVDDTNFGTKHEARCKQLADQFKAKFKVKEFFHIPVNECIRRDSLREGDAKIGEGVIQGMAEKYGLIPVKIVKDPNLSTAIIVDIDGTVAKHVNRSPYDTAKCEEDELIEPISSIIHTLVDHMNLSLIFVSGRDAKFRKQTINWLDTNGFTDYKLFMRPIDDIRKDYIIKTEIFENEIRGKWNILLVLDDRNQTVLGWRQLGLTCLQVATEAF